VRDGKFEFRVLGMTRAAQAGDLSNQFETVDAQGEFIVLTISVTNIGDQAQSYFGTNQKLIDTTGREYGANSEADMWANKGTGDINPGNSIQVRRHSTSRPEQSRCAGSTRLDVFRRRDRTPVTRQDRDTMQHIADCADCASADVSHVWFSSKRGSEPFPPAVRGTAPSLQRIE
jgi:hypothetical protein